MSNLVKVFPESKVQVREFTQKVKEEVLSGDRDPLQFATLFKALEECVKTLRTDEEIREAILTEANKYPGKTFELHSAKFTIRESVTYDYSTDSTWNELNSKLNAIKAEMKDRETFLKSLKTPVADPETGEMINPVSKSSTTSVSVSLL